MSETSENCFQPAGAFQKVWMDTFNQMANEGLALTPDATPPELIRQMRSGVYQALAKAWEEFMDSPQFMESVKAMLDDATAFRRPAGGLHMQPHPGPQGTTRADLDNVVLAIRHLENRVLDRVEKVAARLGELEKSKITPDGNGHAKSWHGTGRNSRMTGKGSRGGPGLSRSRGHPARAGRGFNVPS